MNIYLLEIHPGEILREEFMVPLGLSKDVLVAALDASPSEIDALIAETGPVTPALARSLAAYFTMSVGFWMNLQASYDKRMTEIGGRQ